jgi:hypothetical protein
MLRLHVTFSLVVIKYMSYRRLFAFIYAYAYLHEETLLETA